jgi:large subunit ribosomal protein L4
MALTANIIDATGKTTGRQDLPEELFGGEINTAVLHQVMVAQLAAARAGTASTKTRSEVRGGGKKPWRQKGTGRARHGSIRSPLWVGGGTVFGPKPRDYAQRVPKKMRRAALRSALADKAQNGRIWVLGSFDEARTKAAVATLAGAGISGRVLVVLDTEDPVSERADRAFRNLPKAAFSLYRSLSTYDVLVADDVIFTTSALERFVKKASVPATRPSEDDFVVEGKADVDAADEEVSS